MHALSTFKESPALRHLKLGLRANSVGDDGAAALTALKDAAGLQTLDLDLKGNRLGASGVQQLVALKAAATAMLTLALKDKADPELDATVTCWPWMR